MTDARRTAEFTQTRQQAFHVLKVWDMVLGPNIELNTIVSDKRHWAMEHNVCVDDEKCIRELREYKRCVDLEELL
jgi:hypothetical protein